MSGTSVTQLVNALLDRAELEHPGIEYSITMASQNTLLLPKDNDVLRRQVNGRDGYYRGHVYRDVLINDMPIDGDLIIAGPVVGTIPEADRAATYYGQLSTAVISTEPPQ